MIKAPAMLSVEDVHTYYGQVYVLQGVSLSVDSGQIVTVLGRNGVGKTTLIRSIMAFTPPRRGRIRFADIELTNLPAHKVVRHGIGLVPQGRRIFPSLTVRENLEIAERPSAKPGTETWTLATALDLFPRLAERLGNPAGTLSGGEQQMLAVARALLSNPRLLLMDEPTEGLSPLVVDEMSRLLVRLRDRGLAILLVEQNLAFALAVADHAYVMDKGRMVFAGEAQALAAQDAVVETYLGV